MNFQIMPQVLDLQIFNTRGPRLPAFVKCVSPICSCRSNHAPRTPSGCTPECNNNVLVLITSLASSEPSRQGTYMVDSVRPRSRRFDFEDGFRSGTELACGSADFSSGKCYRVEHATMYPCPEVHPLAVSGEMEGIRKHCISPLQF
jgi:hypothetical protein